MSQEAEKALERLFAYIEYGDLMGESFDTILHDARAALRSLRTQHTELIEERDALVFCVDKDREEIERLQTELNIAKPSMEFAEHKAAELWLAHTKDQERIEELEKALVDLAALSDEQARVAIDQGDNRAAGAWLDARQIAQQRALNTPDTRGGNHA